MMDRLFDLARQAAQLEQAWRSKRLARVGDASLKLMRMDAQAYPDEVHAYAEGLLVLDGEMHLNVAGEAVTVSAGQLYMVPAGVSHAVRPGSHGTLLIIDA
jgi:mannose-6-phosphate isomerase-like protein (cupin superfamily)